MFKQFIQLVAVLLVSVPAFSYEYQIPDGLCTDYEPETICEPKKYNFAVTSFQKAEAKYMTCLDSQLNKDELKALWVKYKSQSQDQLKEFCKINTYEYLSSSEDAPKEAGPAIYDALTQDEKDGFDQSCRTPLILNRISEIKVMAESFGCE